MVLAAKGEVPVVSLTGDGTKEYNIESAKIMLKLPATSLYYALDIRRACATFLLSLKWYGEPHPGHLFGSVSMRGTHS